MSTAVVITRNDHTPAELRASAAKSNDAAKARRLLAIAMVLEGTSRLDAARQAGMDRQTLRDWCIATMRAASLAWHRARPPVQHRN